MTVPNPWRVVVAVLFIERPEDVTEVPPFLIRVEVVFLNEFLDAVRPLEVFRVVKVNLLDGNLVGDHGVSVVRNPLGEPQVARYDFHVPCFILVSEQHGVAGWRTVLGNQFSEELNGLPGGVDERQRNVNDAVLIQPVLYQRVKGQRPFVTVR